MQYINLLLKMIRYKNIFLQKNNSINLFLEKYICYYVFILQHQNKLQNQDNIFYFYQSRCENQNTNCYINDVLKNSLLSHASVSYRKEKYYFQKESTSSISIKEINNGILTRFLIFNIFKGLKLLQISIVCIIFCGTL